MPGGHAWKKRKKPFELQEISSKIKVLLVKSIE